MRSFFYYTKQERRGIVVLAILCFMLFAAQWVLPLLVDEEVYDFSVLQEKVAQANVSGTGKQSSETIETGKTHLFYFTPNLVSAAELKALGLDPTTIRAWLAYRKKGGRFDSAKDVQKFRALSEWERERILPYARFPSVADSASAEKSVSPPESRDLFPFNPNTVSQNDLAAFGIPAASIRAWMNYRSKGGFFRDADALARFRALSPEQLARIRPFLRFEKEKKDSVSPSAYEYSLAPPVTIDVNQASAAEWQELRGIGPAYSKRIVNFRDALGGFITIGQIADTYGLPDSVFQAIQSQLKLSPLIRTLAINQVDLSTLSQHPYIDRKTASILVAYREQHGPYADARALQSVRLPDSTVLKKILPYLDFN